MKQDKEHYLNLFLIIAAPIVIVAGTLFVVIPVNSSFAVPLGYLLICLGVFLFFMWLIRMLAFRSINKEKRQAEQKREMERKKRMTDALNWFESDTDTIELDTVKLIKAGMEFYADGRYVCEKDFKGITGHHFAFEIMSTSLKYKPKDCDDICDIGSSGILISIGYLDGEALEKYANDNGIILQDTPEKSIGQTITLSQDNGYNFNIWTVEGDDIDFGFMKILKYENDTLTLHFLLDVSLGLCDTVEGIVRLKKEASEDAKDISILINRIKWKRYNTIEVSAEEVESIKQVNPFLPESYIEFLSKIGFADMNWIDIGWNRKTPTNLDDEELNSLKEIYENCSNLNLEDFYFIAIDANGRYYAFSKNADAGKVYTILDSTPPFGSFEEFLAEILNAWYTQVLRTHITCIK